MTTIRPARVVAACVAVAALVAGCASVPTSGELRSGSEIADPGDPAPIGVNAEPPRPGAPPLEIVTGFLEAMADSTSTDPARQYLTETAAAAWKPESSVTVYDGLQQKSISEPRKNAIVLSAAKIATLDSRGAWQSEARGTLLVHDFELTRTASGEWRIGKAPAGRLLEEDLVSIAYRPRTLYYFAPSMDILVPDQVYLPYRRSEGQNATLLVQALLAGPTRWLGDAVRSAAPPGTDVNVSVPIDADGVATVALNAAVAGLGQEQRAQLSAQLVWTLKQVPGITGVRLTVNGAPFEVSGRGDVQSMSTWDQYDPSFATVAGRQLYVLRKGHITRVDGIGPEPPETPQAARLDGLDPYDATSFGIDVGGERGAVVTEDAVVTGRLNNNPPQDPVRIPTDGPVLPPSFDKFGNLWIVDRRIDDARIRMVTPEGVPLQVTSQQLSGKHLATFRVARDGVRVLVVERLDNRSRLLVGRITKSESGVEISALRSLHSEFDDLADAGWSKPNKITVLGRNGKGAFIPKEMDVDGSKTAVIQVPAGFDPVELAVSPDAEALVVVRNSKGDVLARQRDLGWPVVIKADKPTYPG